MHTHNPLYERKWIFFSFFFGKQLTNQFIGLKTITKPNKSATESLHAHVHFHGRVKKKINETVIGNE